MDRPKVGKKAEDFVNNLLTQEALDKPSDSVKPDQLELELPKWFDEKKFNQARRFFWDNCFALSGSMLLGLVAVFAIPSILQVLIGSRRSSGVYTAFRRYLSTLLHVVSWFEHELKPNSISWKSLYTVRSRHLRAGLASKMKGGYSVSQRDIALTQFGFIGFMVLKPDRFGVRQLQPGDWDAYNHFWKVMGYMIGLEDRYNICRDSIEETREVCQLLLDRVYTPALENVPEYFEHMATVMLDGMWSVNPTGECTSLLYVTRYMGDVPGYIITEKERIDIETRLREHLKGKDLDSGVDSTLLMEKCAIGGLTPRSTPRLLYLKNYATIESVPEYKQLTYFARYKLAFTSFAGYLYSTTIGRWYLNLNFRFSLWLMKNFPYIAFFRFGVKKSMVDLFVESPSDDTQPKPNKEYYESREKKSNSWRAGWFSFIF